MRHDPLPRLPDEWKFTAVRLHGGGRDLNGDPQLDRRESVPGCLLGPGTSTDPDDFSAFTTDAATLYAPASSVWTSGDRVETPAEAPLAGRWRVTGNPVRWPAGWTVPLEREGGSRG